MRRTVTPTRRQLDAAECGAACLGSILQYFGRYVPPPIMRKKCEVNRDGSRAAALIRAGRFFDLEGKGFRLTSNDIDEISLPAIVHWRNSHFVVLEGYNKRHVFINDPAAGRRRISRPKFAKQFSGIALTFSPTENFAQIGKPPRIFQSLFSRLKGHGNSIAFCMVAALITTVPTLFFAIGCRVFVDECVIRGDDYFIRPLLWLLLIATAFQCLLFWLKSTCVRDLRAALKQSLSRSFMHRLLSKPILFFSRRFSSEVACRFRLNDRVAESISHLMLDTCAGLTGSFIYVLFLFALSPVLATVAVVLISANLLLVRLLSPIRTELSQQLAISEGQLMGVGVETANTLSEIQGTGMQDVAFKRWHHFWREAVSTRLKIETSNSFIASFTALTTLLANTAIIVIGCALVIKGFTTLGVLIAFQVIAPFLTGPVTKAVEAISQLQTLVGDLAKLDDVLHSDDADQKKWNIIDAKQRAKSADDSLQYKGLVARNISFGFRADGKGLFEDLSLDLPGGMWIGFTGSSGSGKSTLARLLGGIYQPTIGAVCFQEQNIHKITDEDRAKLIGYVDQNCVLFPGTVRENLCFGINDVSDREILEVCEELNLSEFIKSIPGGLGGQIVGNGSNVSGGERQRIDIARSLLARPKILILDECTSALDSQSEQAVIEALKNRNLTCVIISHRRSVLENCDRIELFSDGKSVASGTHEKLFENCQTYSFLVNGAANLEFTGGCHV